MSDEIEISSAASPDVVAPEHSPPVLDDLSPAALAQLTLGFYFAFWGLLVLIMALTESLVGVPMRPLSALLVGGGSLGMATGAWRLHRVTGLSQAWQRRTRELVIATVLEAYLALFYIVWRRFPTQLYFLTHALVFFGLLLAILCWQCLTVVALARAASRRDLAVQASAFGTVALVLMVPPFAVVAQRMIEAARAGLNPFTMLQLWVERTPHWLIVLAMFPVALTLSLLWSAKELVLEQLNGRSPDVP